MGYTKFTVHSDDKLNPMTGVDATIEATDVSQNHDKLAASQMHAQNKSYTRCVPSIFIRSYICVFIPLGWQTAYSAGYGDYDPHTHPALSARLTSSRFFGELTGSAHPRYLLSFPDREFPSHTTTTTSCC